MKATCSGCGCSGVPSPARVVTLVPAAADTGSEHDRVGAPSTWTVHAPHCARPQPKCGLLSPSSVAQHVKQRRIRGHLDRSHLLVHLKGDALCHLEPLLGM